MERFPFISVICPVYNEQSHIRACMDSISSQTYPQEKTEVFFVDGRSSDETKEIISGRLGENPGWRLLDNPRKFVPHALNMAIRQAKGEVVIRIDAHSRYPSDYFSVLVEHLLALDADNVGGVWNTLPDGDSSRALAIALACSHALGVGASLHKVGVKKVCKTDTVPYGCFPKAIFDRLGLFDEELIRNQDDEFNGRITRSGGSIYVLPQLVIDYRARGTFRAMSKTYFQYGLFKPLVNKKLGKPATVRQFVPVLFVAGLLAGLPFALFFPVFRHVYVLAAALYLAAIFCIGLKQAAEKRRSGLFLYLPWAFFLLHSSYGIGYWTGLFKLATGRSFHVGSSR